MLATRNAARICLVPKAFQPCRALQTEENNSVFEVHLKKNAHRRVSQNDKDHPTALTQVLNELWVPVATPGLQREEDDHVGMDQAQLPGFESSGGPKKRV